MILNNKTILLAEDDIVIARMYKRGLELSGGKVIMAENGEQALEMLKLGKIDIVLLDLMMPKVNGYEVLRKMKADEKTKGVPVIILTNLDEHPEYIEQVTGTKADEYLVKSNVSVEEIVKTLSRHLG
jgi:DNA-binding response OmpR family regulator